MRWNRSKKRKRGRNGNGGRATEGTEASRIYSAMPQFASDQYRALALGQRPRCHREGGIGQRLLGGGWKTQLETKYLHYKRVGT